MNKNNQTPTYLANHCRVFFVFAGLSGAFSVLFSAWLAHAGSALVVDDQRRLFIALAMQFIHTLILVIVLIWIRINSQQHTNQDEERYERNRSKIRLNKFLLFTAYCFVIGVLCFSGVLYLKTFHLAGFLGKLAPFGGSTLALGWLMLAVSAQLRN